MKVKVTNRQKTGRYINLNALDRPGAQMKFLPSKGSIVIDEEEMSPHLEALARRDFVRIRNVPDEPAPPPVIAKDEDEE